MTDTTEVGAAAMQHVGEIARQNALLTHYRSLRRAGLTYVEDQPIRDLELDALIIQQQLLRSLDALLPDLISLIPAGSDWDLYRQEREQRGDDA